MFYGTNEHHPDWSYNRRNSTTLEYIRQMDKYSCLKDEKK